MARNAHFVPQIEAMGIESLNTGVERHGATTLRFGVIDQPVKELLSVSSGALLCLGHEIVDVHESAVVEALRDAESCHCFCLSTLS